jgi:hypothetical protein
MILPNTYGDNTNKGGDRSRNCNALNPNPWFIADRILGFLAHLRALYQPF